MKLENQFLFRKLEEVESSLEELKNKAIFIQNEYFETWSKKNYIKRGEWKLGVKHDVGVYFIRIQVKNRYKNIYISWVQDLAPLKPILKKGVKLRPKHVKKEKDRDYYRLEQFSKASTWELPLIAEAEQKLTHLRRLIKAYQNLKIVINKEISMTNISIEEQSTSDLFVFKLQPTDYIDEDIFISFDLLSAFDFITSERNILSYLIEWKKHLKCEILICIETMERSFSVSKNGVITLTFDIEILAQVLNVEFEYLKNQFYNYFNSEHLKELLEFCAIYATDENSNLERAKSSFEFRFDTISDEALELMEV